MDAVIAREAEAQGMSLEDVRERFTNGVSLRTFIDAVDVANAILFLTSPAGARITGQEIVVDGHTETA